MGKHVKKRPHVRKQEKMIPLEDFLESLYFPERKKNSKKKVENNE